MEIIFSNDNYLAYVGPLLKFKPLYICTTNLSLDEPIYPLNRDLSLRDFPFGWLSKVIHATLLTALIIKEVRDIYTAHVPLSTCQKKKF